MTTSDGDAAETTGMAAEEEDAKPEALQPCFVCGRKFNPSSLGKHVAICERTGQRKRKPFDSSKQRIKGTELADFLPKRQLEQQQHQQQSPSQSQQQQHHASGTEPTTRARAGQQQQQQQQAGDEAAGKPWKQSRDELLRAIRAARGDDGPHAHGHQHNQSASTQHQHHHQQQQQQHQHHQHQRPSNLSLVTSPGAPKRSYEKGQCPTCQREFGLKSYERHVAFCRERATRLPASPQTCSSVAKERLEARMKYRAPGLRGRKPTNREKYSPGAPRPGGATGASPLLARSPTKEAAGATTTTTTTTRQGAGGGEPASPKLPTLKRQGQSTKDSPITSNGPLKSRPIDRSNSLLRRSFERLPRSDWNNYVRRHPDFSMILRGRIGLGNEYNPFLLAEQQLNELFSDTSDQSSVDAPSLSTPQKPNSSPSCPLARPSAFAKYPLTQNSPQSPLQSPSQFQQQVANNHSDKQLQRASVIAPPTGFDDLTSSDLSSDCTETNSLSREIQTSSSNSSVLPASHVQGEREHVLGRRVIIDQNQALGGGEFAPSKDSQQQQQQQHQKQQQPSKMSNGSHSKLTRPSTMSNGNGCNRSSSMRAASAPKPPERKNSSSSSSGSSDFFCSKKPGQSSLGRSQLTSGSNDNNNKLGNNYKSLNGSNLSLNSIISTTDLEMKRSNSLFDELLSSFEDEANTGSALPSLMSLMRNEPSLSLLSSAAQQNGINGHHQHQRIAGNGRLNCSDDDAELSSPESVKRQECGGKLSADSAYSSLNRKYSSHQDRGCHDANSKLKLSKFCHECGFKFPDSAKFCCECGAKRLTL